MYLIINVLSIIIAYILDFIFGDPYWLYHPVCFIGKMISFSEKKARKISENDSKKLFICGIFIAVAIPLISFFLSFFVLFLAYKINFYLGFIINTFWNYQIIAARCLEKENRKVYNALKEKNIEKSRYCLSMLVGRETDNLSENEIIKASVETIAENTSDGVTAPLFYMFIGSAPLGFLYKAVNTLDSMIGYRNEKYEYLGKASAKTDDILNFIPSRICAVLMIISSFILGFDYKNAFKIFKRDRKNHLSPNSAQTESCMAGALNIQLGGSHIYFGKLVKKPFIGDNIREVKADDIKNANKIMMMTGLSSLILFSIIISAIFLNVIEGV
jgi:adenosylcobinamide-phosphate synthase